MKFFFTLLSITVGLLLGCGSVKELPEAANFEDALKIVGTEYVEQGPLTGVIIGVIRNGKREIYPLGAKNLATQEKPDEYTVFEIGSVTKTFTATLLADRVIAGECKPEDPLQNYLPEVKIPVFEDQPITLLDLVTHTSGLPRMPANIGFYLLKNADNPYATYPVSELYSWLSKYSPKKKTGTSFEYSNAGFGLLGHALGKINQSDYTQSLQQHVLSPLGMNHTTFVLNEEQRKNYALPYSKGKEVSNWDFTDAFAGAGAIKSNLNDMFLYLEAQLGLQVTPIDSAITLTHIPQRPDDGGGKVGMGWMISERTDGKTLIWHNGATGGYQSYIGFVPEEKLGVIILANSATSTMQEATNAGFYLLKAALK
ncbi:MAG: serine hydrolase domain-containing protein [Bacteroidia bacterium]|nr:serine hydrolase domain-containing protein [Bacteroidia bacterium]